MVTEPKILRDGFINLLGVDSSVRPSLIPPDKVAIAGNVFFRGGFPSTRAGFTQLGLTYPTVEIAEWIETHILQGAAVYQPKYGNAQIVASIGGRIFTFDPFSNWLAMEITPTRLTTVAVGFVAPAVGASVNVVVTDGTRIYAGYPIVIDGGTYQVTNVVQDPTPATTYTITVTNVTATPGAVAIGATIIYLDANSYVAPRAWLKQAEFFLIIQDGFGRAIIYDGSKAFRSDVTLQQVPTGTVMAYGKGRLWVAVNKNEFVASDIVRGSSGTPAYDTVDAILYFKENTYVAGGGAFAVPLQSGEITAMEFMPVLDSSTGNGPLIVFTERAAFSVDAPESRVLWADIRSPVQTVVLTGNGAVSAYATVATTNSDIFFRSRDGVRSFILAVREFTNSWGNTPVSTEMSRVLDRDDQRLIRFSSAIQFENRLWFTVAPTPLPDQEDGAYHQGLATLDFHPISNMREKSPPVYDGIHSGLRPTLIFKGEVGGIERAFCWSLNGDNHNELWEISIRNPFDNTDGRIKSFFETKAMFSRSLLELKKLEGLELFLDDVRGRVDFRILYKPDQYPCWFEWGRQQTFCTNWRDCPTESALCTEPITYRPGYKTRMNFGQPEDGEDVADDKPSRLGYEFQLRVEWEGHCTIRKAVMRMFTVEEEPYPTVL